MKKNQIYHLNLTIKTNNALIDGYSVSAVFIYFGIKKLS